MKKHNFVEDNIIILSKQTIDLFLELGKLKQANPADLIALYTFYYYTAKWQQTNQPWCNDHYVKTGLCWGMDRVYKTKKKLIELGLITKVPERNKEGTIIKWYIRINYIWKQETVKQVIQSTQNPIVAEPNCGKQDTNALSANSINALSANSINALSEEKIETVAGAPVSLSSSVAGASLGAKGASAPSSAKDINSHSLKSTSEIQNRPVGLEIASLCKKYFGGDHYLAITNFFEGMEISSMHSKEQRINIINHIGTTYAEIVLIKVIKAIHKKLKEGVIAQYNPSYVFTALAWEQEKHDMEYKYTKFKQFCIDFFKDGSMAIEVHDFYTKLLTTIADGKSKEPSLKEKNITERRIQNAKTLVTTYGLERFLKVARQMQTEHSEGTLKTRSMSYFTNRLKKFANASIKQQQPSQIPAPESKTSAVVSPVPYKLNEAENFPNSPVHNWLYKCECGTIVDPWTDACPKCKAYFNWRGTVTKYSQTINGEEHVG